FCEASPHPRGMSPCSFSLAPRFGAEAAVWTFLVATIKRVVAFNRGQFGDLPHKPTIAAKYAAIVATSRRLSFPACNETDASLTLPSFVERNVCFYGQGPLIRLNSRNKRPSPSGGAEGGGAPQGGDLPEGQYRGT